MLMLLLLGNCDSHCSSRTKLQGEVLVPKEKRVINLAWDSEKHSESVLGASTEALNFTLCSAGDQCLVWLCVVV